MAYLPLLVLACFQLNRTQCWRVHVTCIACWCGCWCRLEKERLDLHLECEDLLLSLEQAEKFRVCPQCPVQANSTSRHPCACLHVLGMTLCIRVCHWNRILRACIRYWQISLKISKLSWYLKLIAITIFYLIYACTKFRPQCLHLRYLNKNNKRIKFTSKETLKPTSLLYRVCPRRCPSRSRLRSLTWTPGLRSHSAPFRSSSLPRLVSR